MAKRKAAGTWSGRAQVTKQRERLVDGLRVYGAIYTDLTRRFAASLGLHATDAAALVEIVFAEDKGEPLSPARLSERISLSPAATTAVLNRLELAEHIVRSREHTDRRVVTIRCNPRIQRPATEFFGPLGARMDDLARTYSPELLQELERFVGDMCTTMQRFLDEHGEV
ncbi:MAG: MarR family transcriptional regulator [Polyangiales bacterium]